MRSASEWWHYNLTSSPTDLTHAENDSNNMDLNYENHMFCCAKLHGTNCWYIMRSPTPPHPPPSLSIYIYIYIYICKIYSWFSVQVLTQSWQMLCPMLSVDIVDRTLAWFEIIGPADSDEYMRTRSYSYQQNCMDYWMIIQTIIKQVLLSSSLLTLNINDSSCTRWYLSAQRVLTGVIGSFGIQNNAIYCTLKIHFRRWSANIWNVNLCGVSVFIVTMYVRLFDQLKRLGVLIFI